MDTNKIRNYSIRLRRNVVNERPVQFSARLPNWRRDCVPWKKFNYEHATRPATSPHIRLRPLLEDWEYKTAENGRAKRKSYRQHLQRLVGWTLALRMIPGGDDVKLVWAVGTRTRRPESAPGTWQTRRSRLMPERRRRWCYSPFWRYLHTGQ